MNAQTTWSARLRRSCVYALIAVVASSALILVLLLFSSKAAAQNPGVGVADVAAYILGFPLLLGWIVSTSIFGSLGSCATPAQFAGVLLTPVISFPTDAALVFVVWEFFYRKMSRGLESGDVLHINR
jgi:hypothetical protein